MSRGVNKVILIGNIGNMGELKDIAGGKRALGFTLATASSYKDKVTGETKSNTEWHKICLFSPLAEIGKQFLKKGSKVYIEGYLKSREWEDKDGKKNRTTEIIANGLNMLDTKQSHDNSSTESKYSTQAAPSNLEFDDEIPF